MAVCGDSWAVIDRRHDAIPAGVRPWVRALVMAGLRPVRQTIPPSPMLRTNKATCSCAATAGKPPGSRFRSDPQVRPTTRGNPGAAATSTILGI